ncbi:MAG TPA: PAS domain S-box protein [Spirochaetota bacterium]|nr:PAS domain S-box protein [Spirochaetota bacterium]HPR49863.1 PAS domain S-box protein [Spirochaetota bacterium]
MISTVTNNKMILLVEDERITAAVEKAMLERQGYRVVTAYNGEDAVRSVLAMDTVDLVLMDIDLGPGMDGTVAAQEILARRDIPVLFLSAHTEPEVVEKTEGITSYGYVVKNSSEAVILASIKMAFRLHRAHMMITDQKQEIEAANEELQSSMEELESTNMELIRSQQELIERDRDLAFSEERFFKIFKANPAPMALTRLRDGVIIDVNKSYELLFEVTREERLEKHFLDLNNFDNPRDHENMLRLISEEKMIRNYELRLSSKTGKTYDILVSSEIVEINNEQCAISILFDISAQKEIERALRESEDRWQFAIEGAGDGLWDWNVEKKRVFYSPLWKSMLGYGEDEISDCFDEWASRLHPDDRDQSLAEVNRHLQGLTPIYSSEHRLRCKDGTYRWVLDRGKVIEHDAEGKPLRVIGTHTDITEHKRALHELEQREKYLRGIFEASPAGIILTDSKGTIEYANRRMADMFGCSLDELLGSNYTEHVHPLERDTGTEKMKQLMMREISQVNTERLYVRKDGSDFWGYLSGRRLDETGEGPSSLVGIIADITEKKNTEKKLRESELEHKLITEMFSDYVFRMNIDENGSASFTNVSENFARITGRDINDVIVMDDWIQAIHPDYKPVIRENLKILIETGGPVDFECITFTKDGQPRWVQMFIRGERETPGGRATSLIGAVRDITARKRAEEQMKKLLEQKEMLMRELQHRVKNNLAMIISLFSLELDRSASEETNTVLQNLRDRVSSLESLYSLLYRSGGVDRLRLDEYIRGIIVNLMKTYSLDEHGIIIEQNCDPVEISVRAAASLGLAVNELVTNALKHAFTGRNGGTVMVTLTKDAGDLLLSVHDNGRELPADFDVEQSVGFGLRLVDMLARQLGGVFSFSRDGGSLFTVRFPAAQ